MPSFKPGDRVRLEGRVGNKPELRQTDSGKPVTDFSLYVDEGALDADGQWQKTGEEKYKVTVWDQQAKHVAQSLQPGVRVNVRGRFDEERPYTTRSGEPATSLDVTAREVAMSLLWNPVQALRAERGAGRGADANGIDASAGAEI
jgi:single-strand DNA-binding protein